MSDSEREQALALPLPESAASSSTDSISAPPVTAEQYLRRVRTEASKLPNTFVASSVQKETVANSKTSLLASHRIVSYPPWLPPMSQTWCARLVHYFRTLQTRVLEAKKRYRLKSAPNLPAANDVHGMQRLLNQSSEGPLLSIILRLDFLRMLCLLTIIDDQLQQVPDLHDLQDQQHQQTASQLCESFFFQCRDQWLFALFTLIQPPLSRDVASVLRSILRKASYARYGVTASEDHRLARLNVLTTVLAQCFGQHDAS